ncbi:MAG: PP2C family protein-serine/threonine phosphatase [Atopobiaceae bacterium]|jgi:serine/threonine protein phosphatase PrpC
MARIAARSDHGRRSSNQDSFGFATKICNGVEISLAVVCDGVGGLSQGEVASSTVVDTLKQWFDKTDFILDDQAGDKILSSALMAPLDALVASANASIYRYGITQGSKMGTTLTCIVCARGHYLVVQVGDSRAYHVSGAGAQLVTEDQTLAARQVLQGKMTREQEKQSPDRGILLQAVGSQEAILPLYYEGSYREGDLFVLLSDGGWHMQESEGIARNFVPLLHGHERKLKKACEHVIKQDLSAGETDNIAVVALGPI